MLAFRQGDDREARKQRAGGYARYAELLAPFGLDASDPQFWQRGLDVIAGFIDELTEDHHGE